MTRSSFTAACFMLGPPIERGRATTQATCWRCYRRPHGRRSEAVLRDWQRWRTRVELGTDSTTWQHLLAPVGQPGQRANRSDVHVLFVVDRPRLADPRPDPFVAAVAWQRQSRTRTVAAVGRRPAAWIRGAMGQIGPTCSCVELHQCRRGSLDGHSGRQHHRCPRAACPIARREE